MHDNFDEASGGKRGGWTMQPPVWGFLQPCLLLVLRNAPQHGYGLMEELTKRELLPEGAIDVGNLYRTLRKMEGAGLVASSWSEQNSGPNKRIYQLTPTGEELLRNWAGSLEKRMKLLTSFLGEFHRSSDQLNNFDDFYQSDNFEDLDEGDNPI